MAEKTISREKAIAIGVIAYLLSVVGTVLVIRKYYVGMKVFAGLLLYSGLFACAFVMGVRSDRDRVLKGIGQGLRAIVNPSPLYALGFVVLDLLTLLLGWTWFWRSTAPLALGVIAGYYWAKQDTLAPKTAPGDQDLKPIDVWKP